MKHTTAELEGIIEKLMHSASLTKREREIVGSIDRWEGQGTECLAFDYIAKKESQELQPDVEESIYYLLPSGQVLEVRTLTLSKAEIEDAFGKVKI